MNEEISGIISDLVKLNKDMAEIKEHQLAINAAITELLYSLSHPTYGPGVPDLDEV